MTAIVSARELTRRYGEGEVAVDALAEVSVEFDAARFAAIMGPSGSGKSTLLNILGTVSYTHLDTILSVVEMPLRTEVVAGRS